MLSSPTKVLSPTMAASAAIRFASSLRRSNKLSSISRGYLHRTTIICSLSQVEPRISNNDTFTVTDQKISLACPICFHKLTLISSGVTFATCSSQTELKCSGCQQRYSGKESHLELAIPSTDSKPLATELFRLPLVSFAYERGWRQSFSAGGFPGPEKEFEMMKNYLNSASGGIIVDASCGSGLFARIFAKSGMFSFVAALDFSENMIQQCADFIGQDDGISKENIMLLRSDIVRLPFVSGSVDAVHAGAAIHCWPSPFTAVAEICRVLKPGGVFVGTTYVLDGLRNLPLIKPISQGATRLSGIQFFLEEGEIENICSSCGLVDYQFLRNDQFIMFSAKKQS